MQGFEYLEVGFKPDEPTFEELYPSLLGPADAEQFIVNQGELYCIRPSCDGCPFAGKCEFVEEELPMAAVPHPRRGIGFEEKTFQILRFMEGHSFETLPKELWDNPYADKAYAHEANLHWAYTEPKTATLHTLKGQVRFYGTAIDFYKSAYAEYFEIADTYEPIHHPVSLDYSAIEPRVSTLVSREPEWLKTFQGVPKAIFKEVILDVSPVGKKNLGKSNTVLQLNGRTYCFLKGEMDKEDYAAQCGKCLFKDNCTVKQEHLKRVPTDWHGVNTAGLYGPDFTECTDKFRKKELRGIGKIVGLALTYGGSSFTVAGNMGCSKEEAQARIDNFFRALTVLNAYMKAAKQNVLRTGKVVNLFGRLRDVSDDAFPSNSLPDKERRKKQGYAQRTALNHPIQSTAADILKIGKIRADDYIRANGLSPIYENHLPRRFEKLPTYRDLIATLASSIHDEVFYLIRTDRLDSVIPPLYIAMQLEDVLQKFQVGFSLELDCEFDQTRSWTAGTAFDTAHIYLLRHTQGLNGAALPGVPAGAGGANPTQPNLALINFEDITPELLHHLSAEAAKIAAASSESGVPHSDDESLIELGVLHNGHYYLHGGKFPSMLLQSLGLAHRMVFYHHRPQ